MDPATAHGYDHAGLANEAIAVARRLERSSANDLVQWAVQRFDDDLVLAASFQDCVLIDLVAKVKPNIEVLFLDTQYHFAETLWYVAKITERYGLELRVVTPSVVPDDLWQTNTQQCCHLRKVDPLRRYVLNNRKIAWLSGARRAESPSRATLPLVGFYPADKLVRIHPLALWSDRDVSSYISSHDLLVHPLAQHNYTSIGCWPCTAPTSPGQHARAGRWERQSKTECGLHE